MHGPGRGVRQAARPRSGRRAFTLAVTVVGAVAAVVLSAGREPVVDTVAYPLNAVALGVTGLLIGLRLPRHRIGLLLTAVGLLAATTELVEGYGYHDTWPGALVCQWFAVWLSPVGAVSTVAILALFPTGRPLPGRWRVVPWLAVAAAVFSALGAAFSHASDSSYSFTRGGNPYAVAEPVTGTLWTLGQVTWAVTCVLAVASLVVRYRRGGTVERQQLTWVFWWSLLLLVVGPAAIFAFDRSALVQVAIALLVPLLPVTVCVAVLRHRLYDVDLLLSRTVASLLVAVALGATWAGTAFVLGGLLGRGHSSWVSAGATLAAAVGFHALYRRTADAVDRALRGDRHRSLARVDAYLDDLRAGRADVAGLEQVVRDAVGDPLLQLRILPVHEAPNRAAPADGLTVTRVVRDGVPLAEVVHAPASGTLLDDVLERAGLALEIARLQAEVTARLAEVEASRARLASAAEAERRRLARDLHDGAQQRLVSVGLALRHVQHGIDGTVAAQGIESAVRELAAAIDDLRELAHGVRPAPLDDGLDAALRELAGRTPLPVRVSTAAGSVPPDVEATAYFVACEALANAVKHAGARQLRVTASRERDDLVVVVEDDGVGGASAASGSGLRGLADRVGALGGRLDLLSPREGGTTLTVRLPCVS